MRQYYIAMPLLGLAALIAASALSLPRLAVESGTPCKTCHINPNGGGMRNEYGNHAVAFNELVIPQTKPLVNTLYRSPRLGEAATVGFDIRYLQFDDGRLFRMQTDAYLALEPWKNFVYELTFSENGITENYALLQIDHQRYFVKVGRFYPAFGLRNADHTAYVRERTGHLPLLYLDGFSVGAEFHGFNITTEFFEPDDRGVYGLHLFRAGYIAPFGYLVGTSLQLSENIGGSNGRFPHSKSIFGGVSYDRFTALAELDLAGRSNDTLITYANLTTRLEYGLYAIIEYNYFDGDRHRRNGVDEFLRISAEVFPLPFVELRPSYTRYTRGVLANTDDFFVQLHFGY